MGKLFALVGMSRRNSFFCCSPPILCWEVCSGVLDFVLVLGRKMLFFSSRFARLYVHVRNVKCFLRASRVVCVCVCLCVRACECM